MSEQQRTPLLVIDDDPVLLESYLSILQREPKANPLNYFSDTAAPIAAAEESTESFQVTTAEQGEEGVAKARQALLEGTPYPLAFIDMRMPPGIDGLETARQLRKLDHRIYIVIVTAFADRSVDELHQVLEYDVLLLKKPFVNEEIFQLARNLTQSWEKDRTLEQSVARSEMDAAYYGGISEVSAFMLHNFGNAIAGVDHYLYDLRRARKQVGQLSEMLLQSEQRLKSGEQLPSYRQIGVALDEFGSQFLDPSLDSAIEVINYMKSMLENQRAMVKEGSPFWCSDFELKEALEPVIDLLRNSMQTLNIRFEYQLDESLNQLHLPKHPLQQLVMSLLNNGVDSIVKVMKATNAAAEKPEREHYIKLRIKRLAVSSSGLNKESKMSSQSFEIRVLDSGEPFSSTQERGYLCCTESGAQWRGGIRPTQYCQFCECAEGGDCRRRGERWCWALL